MKRTTRAYNAGAHVHNFFAAIGHGVYTGAKAVGTTIRDFAVGVKEGGEAAPEVEKKAKARGSAVTT
jgi:hypothetical protein